MTPKDIELHRLMGDPRTCIVKETEGKKGSFDVLAPSVGHYDRPPAVGTFVKPGSMVGYLTVLRRYFYLLVPEGHHGVITDLHVSTRKQRVDYGQPLFSVSPETHAVLGAEYEEADAVSETAADGIPEGMFGVKSPTDGIFYRRANPQSPVYIEEGATVSTGTVLGLVEVMKCFNPIVYPGEPEFPPTARIQRIIPKDSSEVQHGSLLFVVEPV